MMRISRAPGVIFGAHGPTTGADSAHVRPAADDADAAFGGDDTILIATTVYLHWAADELICCYFHYDITDVYFDTA